MEDKRPDATPKWANNLLTICGCGILLIFALAVLFSVPSKPREKARQISCASNEKQLGLAIMQYVQDNDNHMPNIADAPGSTNTWRKTIYPYVESQWLYLCPSRSDKGNGPDGFHQSYAANYNGSPTGAGPSSGNGAFGGAGAKPVRVSDFDKPASLISLCESAGGNTPEFNIDDPVHFGPDARLLWAGHTGGSNYLLADGHAKWLRPDATKDIWHRNTAIPLSPNGIAVLADAQKRAGG
jgi:prepilin-type processing-associated H-X9-DG protein